jgi:hypothetical protein
MHMYAKLTGQDKVVRALGNARREIQSKWKTSVTAELLKGVRTIQRQYRSMEAVGPGGTTRRTSDLVSSYSKRVTISGSDIIGEMGLLKSGAKGKALVYGRVWELGGLRRGKRKRTITPRPAGGAINLVGNALVPALRARLERDTMDGAVGR